MSVCTQRWVFDTFCLYITEAEASEYKELILFTVFNIKYSLSLYYLSLRETCDLQLSTKFADGSQTRITSECRHQ